MTNKEKYIKAQEAFIELTGLKEGSKVKILRKAKSREFGWDNSWSTPTMDTFIGQTLTVTRTSGATGIYCGAYWYPFYCLEVVEVTLPKIPLNKNREYFAEIQEDGAVKVGCQDISFETLEMIYLAAKKQTSGD